MSSRHPCRRFLAHRHCQDVVNRYMAGTYPVRVCVTLLATVWQHSFSLPLSTQTALPSVKRACVITEWLRVLTGIYRGSFAALPLDASLAAISMQTLLQLFKPLCLGRLPFEICAVRAQQQRFVSVLEDADSPFCTFASDCIPIETLSRCKRQSSCRPPMKWIHYQTLWRQPSSHILDSLLMKCLRRR
jgi:hypothetical protein